MEEFIYTIKPTRPNFIASMTKEETSIMENHFHYLQGLLANGTLIMAGPCTDGAFGIVVMKAESLESARSLMEKDPAVAAGIMNVELHPFRISLLQGR